MGAWTCGSWEKVAVTDKGRRVVGVLRDTMPRKTNNKNGAGTDLNPGFAKPLASSLLLCSKTLSGHGNSFLQESSAFVRSFPNNLLLQKLRNSLLTIVGHAGVGVGFDTFGEGFRE